MGQDMLGSVGFLASIVLTVVSLIVITLSASSGKALPFTIGTITTTLLLLSMALVRHCLRGYYLHPYFDPSTVMVKTQWDLLIPFLVLAAALIWYLTWLVGLVWGAYNKPNTTQEVSHV
jgi:hypothetical protein